MLVKQCAVQPDNKRQVWDRSLSAPLRESEYPLLTLPRCREVSFAVP